MRYSDASHVDSGNFYSRRHEYGEIYRLVGYAAVILAWLRHDQTATIEHLLVVLILVWLSAWYLVVGTLWRSSLVAAMVLCAGILTWQRCIEVAVPGMLVQVGPS